jgi:hypothetical protein
MAQKMHFTFNILLVKEFPLDPEDLYNMDYLFYRLNVPA